MSISDRSCVSDSSLKRKKRPKKEKTFHSCTHALGLGTLTVASSGLTSFEGLLPTEVSVMFLQNNYFETFEHFGVHAQLKELYLQDNCLEGFRFAEEQPKLQRVDLRGNPLARLRSYRVMCLLAFGKQLRYIDDTVVSSLERAEARKHANIPHVLTLVRLGWILDGVARSEEDYAALVVQYQTGSSRAASFTDDGLADKLAASMWKGPALDIDPSLMGVRLVAIRKRGTRDEADKEEAIP